LGSQGNKWNLENNLEMKSYLYFASLLAVLLISGCSENTTVELDAYLDIQNAHQDILKTSETGIATRSDSLGNIRVSANELEEDITISDHDLDKDYISSEFNEFIQTLSDEEKVKLACSDCFQILSDMNLANGNARLIKDLVASEEYALRLAIIAMNDRLYKTVTYFEQNVYGRLLSLDEIKHLSHDMSFKEKLNESSYISEVNKKDYRADVLRPLMEKAIASGEKPDIEKYQAINKAMMDHADQFSQAYLEVATGLGIPRT
jgi:hypothetical protein